MFEGLNSTPREVEQGNVAQAVAAEERASVDPRRGSASEAGGSLTNTTFFVFLGLFLLFVVVVFRADALKVALRSKRAQLLYQPGPGNGAHKCKRLERLNFWSQIIYLAHAQ